MDFSTLNQKSKDNVKGKIGILFLISLIIGLVSLGAGFLLGLIPEIGSLISAIVVTPALSLSLIRVYLMVVRGQEVKAGDAFCGFNNFWGAFKVTFLVGIYTFLWSLLFVIPGIIKSIEYSLAMYIYSDNPTMGANDCIARSKEWTEGYKLKIFVYALYYSLLFFLGAFTLGIAYIWIIPYTNAHFANLYEEIKKINLPPMAEQTPATETPAEGA